MENRKFLIVSVFLLAGLVVAPSTAFSYADRTAHPALTQETVEFFNHHYPEQVLSNDERELLMEGSIEEDSPIWRPLNHFYDPVYNRGILGNETSKEWANDSVAQARSGGNMIAGVSADLFSAESDYSWERAIYDYVHGNKERALRGLGHIVHLIQDASVPDHTRNDPHPPLGELGSPYEGWTAQFSPGLNIAETLIEEGENPVLYADLNTYFDVVAGFSNTNFFSADTIEEATFEKPDLVTLESANLNNSIQILYSNLGPLLFLEETRNSQSREINRTYYLEANGIDKEIVLDNYWNTLSREAVLNGAGVIKLFFDEVEKERETGELLAKNTSWIKKAAQKTTAAIGSVFNKTKTTLATLWPFNSGGENQGAALGTIDLNQPLDEPVTSNTNTGQSTDLENEPQNPPQETSPSTSNTTTEDQNQTQQNLSEEEFQQELARLQEELSDIENQVNQIAQNSQNSQNQNQQNATPPSQSSGFGGGGTSATAQNNNQNDTTDQQSTDNSQQSTTDSSDNEDQQDQETEDETNENTSTTSDQEQTDTTAPPMLSIVAPANSAVSTSTPVVVTGTSTEKEVLVVEETTGATTTADQNGDWSLLLDTLTQGTTTLSFIAEDQAGNQSTSTAHRIFLDTVAPTLSLSIPQCTDQSLFSDNCVLTSGDIDVRWSADTEATTTTFTLQHGTTTTHTTATSTTLSLPEGITDISISTADTYGNIETQTKQIAINSAPVVINEVAWMGTEASSADEWIELHNTTDQEISLVNWQLRSEDGTPTIQLTGAIEAGGYYLLERTDDDTVSDVTADHIYTGALNNNDDELYLERIEGTATTTIDTAPARCGRFGGDWCAGLNSQHLSMERIDPRVPGTDTENWEDSLGIYHEESVFLNGTDADGNEINGTPRAENSINALVSPDAPHINEDITLTKERSPYVVTRNGLEIGNGAELTIEPGVVIKVVSPNEPRILIEDDATLIAEGTEDEPIVFTAFADDQYGGDTNKDGMCDPDNASSTAACPFPGGWKHLMFSESTGVLEHTIIRYGGRYFNHSSTLQRSVVSADHTDITLDHVTIEHGPYHGFAWEGGNVVLTNSTIRGHGEGENLSCGADGERGTVTITGNTFAENITGLCVSETEGDIIDNEFIDNTNPGEKTGIAMRVRQQKSGSIITGNTGEGNDNNAIGLRTGTVASGESLTLKQNELPYLVVSQLTIGETSELIFEPGAVVKFDDRDLFVKGTLKAQGTSNQPVVFTTILDDEYGGDLQGNGPSSNVGTNDDGIRLEDNATSTFFHVIFRYFDPALSYEQDTPIDLADIVFEHNETAIEAESDTPILRAENITFTDNEATSTIPLIQTATP